MKNPVLDLNDFLKLLKNNQLELNRELRLFLAPEDIKKKTSEALVSSKGKSAVAMKEIIDNLSGEAYCRGQLSVVEHLILIVEKQIQNYVGVEDGSI